jgi:hypothetical protein
MMTHLSGAAEGSSAPMPPAVFCSALPARNPGSRKGRPRTQWPQTRLDQLRTLFDQGLSHLLIAGRMGVGKGVVSAKIARLGWTRTATLEAVPVAPALWARPQPIFDPRRLKRLEALGARDCHWPMTEDAQGVQLFCGCAKAREVAYCRGHQARAFRRPFGWERQAAQPARDRRPAVGERLGWERFEAGATGLRAKAR